MIDPKDIIVVKVVRSYDGVNYGIYPKDEKWELLKPIGTDKKLDELMSDVKERYFKANFNKETELLELLTEMSCGQNLNW